MIAATIVLMTRQMVSVSKTIPPVSQMDSELNTQLSAE